YLHQLDRVQGAAHYEIGDDRARQLPAGVAARVSGYLGTEHVREDAGGRGTQSVPRERVMQLVDAGGKDLPVLMLVNAVDDERLLQSAALGARGLVLRGHKSQIEHSIRTEWTDLNA